MADSSSTTDLITHDANQQNQHQEEVEKSTKSSSATENMSSCASSCTSLSYQSSENSARQYPMMFDMTQSSASAMSSASNLEVHHHHEHHSPDGDGASCPCCQTLTSGSTVNEKVCLSSSDCSSEGGRLTFGTRTYWPTALPPCQARHGHSHSAGTSGEHHMLPQNRPGYTGAVSGTTSQVPRTQAHNMEGTHDSSYDSSSEGSSSRVVLTLSQIMRAMSPVPSPISPIPSTIEQPFLCSNWYMYAKLAQVLFHMALLLFISYYNTLPEQNIAIVILSACLNCYLLMMNLVGFILNFLCRPLSSYYRFELISLISSSVLYIIMASGGFYILLYTDYLPVNLNQTELNKPMKFDHKDSISENFGEIETGHISMTFFKYRSTLLLIAPAIVLLVQIFSYGAFVCQTRYIMWVAERWDLEERRRLEAEIAPLLDQAMLERQDNVEPIPQQQTQGSFIERLPCSNTEESDFPIGSPPRTTAPVQCTPEKVKLVQRRSRNLDDSSKMLEAVEEENQELLSSSQGSEYPPSDTPKMVSEPTSSGVYVAEEGPINSASPNTTGRRSSDCTINIPESATENEDPSKA